MHLLRDYIDRLAVDDSIVDCCHCGESQSNIKCHCSCVFIFRCVNSMRTVIENYANEPKEGVQQPWQSVRL